jgi:hypothetical protein
MKLTSQCPTTGEKLGVGAKARDDLLVYSYEGIYCLMILAGARGQEKSGRRGEKGSVWKSRHQWAVQECPEPLWGRDEDPSGQRQWGWETDRDGSLQEIHPRKKSHSPQKMRLGQNGKAN